MTSKLMIGRACRSSSVLRIDELSAIESGRPCRSPATKKGRCRLHGGANGSGGPPGERNGRYRHGERTKAAIAEQKKFSALLKMLRAGLT
jgi:hypothetical protein